MKTVQSMLDEANAAVPRISPDEAKKLVGKAEVLFLDAIVTATLLPGVINTDRDAAEAGNLRAYIHADYHHDIFPGHDMTRVWGRIIYPWKSDKHGFRTGTCGPGEAEKAWPAIFVIGDSFVETIPPSFSETKTKPHCPGDKA